jgi:hypothetical protein
MAVDELGWARLKFGLFALQVIGHKARKPLLPIQVCDGAFLKKKKVCDGAAHAHITSLMGHAQITCIFSFFLRNNV